MSETVYHGTNLAVFNESYNPDAGTYNYASQIYEPRSGNGYFCFYRRFQLEAPSGVIGALDYAQSKAFQNDDYPVVIYLDVDQRLHEIRSGPYGYFIDSGDIPVIKAVVGPHRIGPTNPDFSIRRSLPWLTWPEKFGAKVIRPSGLDITPRARR